MSGVRATLVTKISNGNFVAVTGVPNSLSNRRLTIRHIAEYISINCSRAHRIVSEDLGMRKVSARWVPRMLIEEQNEVRVKVFTKAKPQTIFDGIMTQDDP